MQKRLLGKILVKIITIPTGMKVTNEKNFTAQQPLFAFPQDKSTNNATVINKQQCNAAIKNKKTTLITYTGRLHRLIRFKPNKAVSVILSHFLTAQLVQYHLLNRMHTDASLCVELECQNTYSQSRTENKYKA
jgi:hypothetical protein